MAINGQPRHTLRLNLFLLLCVQSGHTKIQRMLRLLLLQQAAAAAVAASPTVAAIAADAAAAVASLLIP